MATKQEIARTYIKRNSGALLEDLSFSELAEQFDNNVKARLMRAIIGGNEKRAGRIMVQLGKRAARIKAQTTVTAILADDQVSLAEMDGFL